MSVAQAADGRSRDEPEPAFAQVLALCRMAREAGLDVNQARVMDACRALAAVDWARPDDVRVALRVNLAGSPADEMLFDRVFAEFWGAPAAPGEGDTILARSEFLRGDLDAGRSREAHREMLSESDSFAADEVRRRSDLALRWEADAPPLERVIRELARRLATRPSRRHRPARHGTRVDLRRSLRTSIPRGLEVLELARTTRRTRRTRFVLLCDVSGSMDAFNPFLLKLMFGLQRALPGSRTLAFSTRTSDITADLRRRSTGEVLRALGERVRHWSGGTDIGGALAELNRGVLREGVASATVVLVVSDGYDNGPPERIAQELAVLKRRVRALVWINPMYGAATFSVRAAGLRAALPYVDHFLPAFDARALHRLVAGLRALS